MTKEKLPENIDDKLYRLKYKKDQESHLIIDEQICKTCKEKPCTYICPASVYVYEEKEDKIKINYENCLECGACRISCEKKAIKWLYPKAKFGVNFKYG